MALTILLQVSLIPPHQTHYHFLNFENSPKIAPNYHSTGTTGWSTVQRRVKKSDTSLTTTPTLLSPMAAPRSVSTFGPPSIASRAFRPVSAIGRKLGLMPWRGRIKPELQNWSTTRQCFLVYWPATTPPLSIIHPIGLCPFVLLVPGSRTNESCLPLMIST